MSGWLAGLLTMTSCTVTDTGCLGRMCCSSVIVCTYRAAQPPWFDCAAMQMNSTEQQLVWDPMGEDTSSRQNPLTLSGELSSLTTGATLGALANSLGGSLGGNQGSQPAPQGSSGGSQHGSQRWKDAKQWVAQMR